jgi:hypothetical protein
MSVTAMRSSPLKPGVRNCCHAHASLPRSFALARKRTSASPTTSSSACARPSCSAFCRRRLTAGSITVYDVFAELVAIGRGCGSSAWVYGLGAVHQWFVACFPKQAQEEFWARDAHAAAAISASTGTR